MLQIITDSASDITLQQAEEMSIHIVPLDIRFEDGPYLQETEADFDNFYKRLVNAENLPVTSQPSPEKYLSLFQEAERHGDEVLVLTISSGLSGTINAANTAKEICGYPKIHIVDSKQAIVAQRILVEQAVIFRDEGMKTEEMIQRLLELRERITVSGMLDTLTYLRKGGRIPSSLALIGNTLRIKPVIALEECVLKTVGKGIGRKAGKRLLYKRFEKYEPDPAYPVYFAYSSNRSMGEEFMQETIEKYQLFHYQTRLFPAGGVIGTHVGTNCIAICYVSKNPVS